MKASWSEPCWWFKRKFASGTFIACIFCKILSRKQSKPSGSKLVKICGEDEIQALPEWCTRSKQVCSKIVWGTVVDRKGLRVQYRDNSPSQWSLRRDEKWRWMRERASEERYYHRIKVGNFIEWSQQLAHIFFNCEHVLVLVLLLQCKHSNLARYSTSAMPCLAKSCPL